MTKSEKRKSRGLALSKPQRRRARRIAEKVAAYEAAIKASGKNGASAFTKPGNASCHS